MVILITLTSFHIFRPSVSCHSIAIIFHAYTKIHVMMIWPPISPFVIIISLYTSVLGSPAPSVTIDAGTIHGGSCSGGLNASFFKSIPYALPPVGSSRFQPAQAYTGKYPDGILNGTVAAPSCIQFGDLFPEPPPTSENW